MDLFNNAPAYFDEDDRYFNEDSTRDDDPPVMQALYQIAERIAALPTVRIANPQRMRQVMAVKAALEQLQIENGERPLWNSTTTRPSSPTPAASPCAPNIWRLWSRPVSYLFSSWQTTLRSSR